jgi:hypothetical protein
MTLEPRDAQDLRHAVLQVLYVRQLIPLTVEAIYAAARRLVPFRVEATDMLKTLEFHRGLNNVEKILDPWGAEDTWKITSGGILAHERDPNKVAG